MEPTTLIEEKSIYLETCMELLEQQSRQEKLISECRRIKTYCLDGFSKIESITLNQKNEFGCWAISKSSSINLFCTQDLPLTSASLVIRAAIEPQTFQIWQHGIRVKDFETQNLSDFTIGLNNLDLHLPFHIFTEGYRKPKNTSDTRMLHWWLKGAI